LLYCHTGEIATRDCVKPQTTDYRLWCLERPIGYFRPYKATVAFGNSDVRTVGYGERIRFPNPEAHDDDLFELITDKKDELLNSSKFNANDLIEQEQKQDPEDAKRETKIKTAQSARDNGLSTREVASIVDMSQSWVDKYTNPPTEPEATTSADD
jgi:hypothetical protein